MKRSWLYAAGATALAAAASLGAPAFAASPDAVCLDALCRQQSIFGLGVSDSAGGGGAEVTAKHYGAWGVDLTAMDPSVTPGDNFYRFAEGKGVDALVIPPDRSSWGSFQQLGELSERRTKALVHADVDSASAAGTDAAKIAALYQSYIDEARVESLGLKPLAGDLAAIADAKTRPQIAALMGHDIGSFGGSFFAIFVYDDAKAPSQNALYVSQSGLGLPDRDYYLKPAFAETKAKYQAYVAQLLKLAGWRGDPAAQAKAVVDLETRIAEVSWTKIEQRDDDKTYNPMTIAQLQAAAPGFPWTDFLGAAGVGQVERPIVAENTAFPKIAAIFGETPVETLQAWQAFHTVDDAASKLPKAFSDAHFAFHGTVLSGQPEDRTREKRAVAFADGAMGEALGRQYVADYFPPESKAKMDALVANIRTALRHRIENLAWMSPATKTQALYKLDHFTVKIGYPVKWRDYSGLTVDPGDLYGNAQRSGAFEWAYDRAKLGKPVDKLEWGMTPQTVNAYYSPVKNEIVFPAAILQPPFFDPNADPAVNYGGIGGVIGHEMTHGFDDQGRKSDGDGVLRDWWTAEDAAKFQIQADKYGKQYDTYQPMPGVHVQGGLTMGENIADLGGINLGLDAYHTSLAGKPAPVLDGWTGDQRVFMGWAQVWRAKYRDAEIQRRAATDPHSPPTFRVIGPLRNVDAWYKAFNVQPGQTYYVAPEDRVRIW